MVEETRSTAESPFVGCSVLAANLYKQTQTQYSIAQFGMLSRPSQTDAAKVGGKQQSSSSSGAV